MDNTSPTTTLSKIKIDNLLSLTGNNKCFECECEEVEWVSFPSCVFLCSLCVRSHKEFKLKQTLKCLAISEFTENEIKKLNIGGNARFHKLLNEYKVPLKEPNIEHKYLTKIATYYYKLLDVQINRINKIPNSEEEYNNFIKIKPDLNIGCELDNSIEEKNVQKDNYTTNSSLGSWFGYFGDKISSIGNYMGINNIVNNSYNKIDNTLNEYGIKEKFNGAVDYAKNAGGYMFDKAKEFSGNATEVIGNSIVNIKNTAVNMINGESNGDKKENGGNVIKEGGNNSQYSTIK